MMTVFLVIVVFAVIQSLFGVGLLVFGTPTLLLLGHPFPETLAILLPASLTISALQCLEGPPIERSFLGDFARWCLAPLAVTLGLVLTFHLKASLNLLVALVLLVFVALRLNPAFNERVKRWVVRREKLWLVLMGLAHGFSNLGGGLLTVLAASRYEDKERIRKLTATCYLWFAGTQLTVLALLSPGVLGWVQVGYAATAAVVFLGVGRHIFRWVSAPAFTRLFTGLMAGYATMLGLRAFKLI